MILELFTFPPALDDDGERETGKGVGVNDDTEGFENVGMVVVVVENSEADEVAALSGMTASFALNCEIAACWGAERSCTGGPGK